MTDKTTTGSDAAPLNGIAATLQHDEGAIACCFYCGRYSLDPATLGDRQPVCECGKKHGWSGSFVKPGPDARWSGKVPSTAPVQTTGSDAAQAARQHHNDSELVVRLYNETPTASLNVEAGARIQELEGLLKRVQPKVSATGSDAVDLDKSRAEFEAWIGEALRKTYPHMHDDSLNRKLWKHGDGEYMDLQTQHDWSVWQIAQARAAAPALPQGFVLVPTEPTDDMVEYGRGQYAADPDRNDFGRFADIYRAMIAIAPSPLESAAAPAATAQAIPAERAPRSDDPREQAHAAGWNACREKMLAALSQQPVQAAGDDAGCWSDHVACDKCGQMGWHVCRPAAPVIVAPTAPIDLSKLTKWGAGMIAVGWQDNKELYVKVSDLERILSAPTPPSDSRIKYLQGLVDTYGPKSLQYDIEHPNDGLNSPDPDEVLRTARSLSAPTATSEPVARTYMTNEQAFKWAWDTLKKELGADRWTAGDKVNSWAFFKYGWDWRGQYESQRAAPAPQQAAPLTDAPIALSSSQIFEIATPYFVWNAETWHKATEGNIGMPMLLEFTRAAINANKSAGSAASAGDAVPPPCDSAIHENGATVAVLDGGMLAMEGLVKEASRRGPAMDWHYFGGRAVVKTLADPAEARAALERAMPRFIDRAPMAATEEKKQ